MSLTRITLYVLALLLYAALFVGTASVAFEYRQQFEQRITLITELLNAR